MVRIRFQIVSGRKGTARTQATAKAGIRRGFHRNTITAIAQAPPTQLAREYVIPKATTPTRNTPLATTLETTGRELRISASTRGSSKISTSAKVLGLSK